MNYVDIFLIALLAWAAWRGFRKGLVIEVFATLSLFIGLYGAIHFSDYAGDHLQNWFDIKENYLPAIAFGVTFIALVVAVHFMAKAISKLVNIMALGMVNKLFGLLFAVFKAALLMSVVLMLLSPVMKEVGFPARDVRNDALLYEPVEELAPTLLPAIEDTEFYRYFKKRDWIPDDLNLPLRD